MAREYKRVLKECHDTMSRVCIKLTCDKCGRESEIPEQNVFQSLGGPGSGLGSLHGYDSMIHGLASKNFRSR